MLAPEPGLDPELLAAVSLDEPLLDGDDSDELDVDDSDELEESDEGDVDDEESVDFEADDEEEPFFEPRLSVL